MGQREQWSGAARAAEWGSGSGRMGRRERQSGAARAEVGRRAYRGAEGELSGGRRCKPAQVLQRIMMWGMEGVREVVSSGGWLGWGEGGVA